MEAPVEFLLQNLSNLFLYHEGLISSGRSELVQLEADLRTLSAILKAAHRKYEKDEVFKEWVKQAREIVYDIEDTIDNFVTVMGTAGSKVSLFLKFSSRDGLNQLRLLRESKVKMFFENYNLKLAPSLTRSDISWEQDEDPNPIVRQPAVRAAYAIVGFDDVAEEMIGYLREEMQELDVMSIVGMPGLGKTSVVSKIFHDPRIRYEFPTLIWVYVSQQFSRKNVLLSILKELTKNVSDDMKTKSDQDLARIVATHLDTGRFLLVLDDVWKAENWKEIKEVLPMNNNMGKIMITSRNVEVGNCANHSRVPHQLRFLTEEESLQLLQQEVFGTVECPKELEVYGKRIVDECNGLPLAIVVIGGILAKKVSATEDTGLMVSTWKTVSENVNRYMFDGDSTKLLENVIALSYDALPYHLRACFLYLGMFPEDAAIPAWRLTCMWIAEGFIQQMENMSLEEVAESYLEDLINSNLLSVDARRRDGKVKTCRIHDVLRDFCINEAGSRRENFLQEIKWSEIKGFHPPLAGINHFRRVCVHSNATSFVSSELYGPRVRSFVHFSDEETRLPTQKIATIPEAFKLLRVLEVKPIRFPRLPINMFKLIHLRYLTLSFSLNILPKSFTKLWNIETLIVDTTEKTLEIKADIWNMKQLRHFKTNASAALPKPEKGTMGSENIITLGTISHESCTEEVFDRARKVKKLGIRGRLATLLTSKKASFDHLGKLRSVEKLKLINDVFPLLTSENPLPRLPPPYQFPPNMKSLTLADTYLDWNQMSVLGQLEYLKVLKLNDKAFMGKTWNAVDGGFRELEVLYIGSTNLVIWTASSHHFPKLRSLELKKCEDLKEVPIELAEIPRFKVLDLYRTNKSAVISARKIQQKRKKMHAEAGKTKSSEFKLSIFPPEE